MEHAIQTPGPAYKIQPLRAIATGLIVLTVHAHARFIISDDRVPGDLGMYYSGVPHAFDLVMGRTPGTLDEWAHTVFQPTGWYHLLLARIMAVLGRGQDTFLLPGVLWVLLLLVGVYRLGRWIAGDGGGLIAVALTAAMPGVFLSGRTSWIHVPEAALVLSALALWVDDPDLGRRRTAVGMGALGALTLALRPSGLVWVGSLAALLLVRHLRARRGGKPLQKGRLLGIGLAWLAGAAVAASRIGEYLQLKALARDRYDTLLPELGMQLQMLLGALPGVVAVLGLAAGALGWQRARKDNTLPRLPDPASDLLKLAGLWVVASLGLWLVSRAGLDNFTLLCPALALLAAAGLSRIAPTAGAALAVLAFLPAWGLQWISPPDQSSLLRAVPGLREIPIDPHVLSAYRPLDGFGEEEIEALVDATCGENTPPQRCTVVADQGLFAPFGEEPGYLELFLSGETRVRLYTIRDQQIPMSQRVEALAEYHCGDRDPAWRYRWPRSLQNLEELMERSKLEPVWSQQVGPGCTFLWLTPRGYLAHPQLLPRTGQRLMAGQPSTPDQLRGAEPPERELMERIRPGQDGPVRQRGIR